MKSRFRWRVLAERVARLPTRRDPQFRLRGVGRAWAIPPRQRALSGATSIALHRVSDRGGTATFARWQISTPLKLGSGHCSTAIAMSSSSRPSTACPHCRGPILAATTTSQQSNGAHTRSVSTRSLRIPGRVLSRAPPTDSRADAPSHPQGGRHRRSARSHAAGQRPCVRPLGRGVRRRVFTPRRRHLRHIRECARARRSCQDGV